MRFHEPDAERFALAVTPASSRRMSIATLVEAAIVLDEPRRWGRSAVTSLMPFWKSRRLNWSPSRPTRRRRRAVRAEGSSKGNHPVGTEQGVDCFGYALARSRAREPRLFQAPRLRTHRYRGCLTRNTTLQQSWPAHAEETTVRAVDQWAACVVLGRSPPSIAVVAGSGDEVDRKLDVHALLRRPCSPARPSGSAPRAGSRWSRRAPQTGRLRVLPEVRTDPEPPRGVAPQPGTAAGR